MLPSLEIISVQRYRALARYCGYGTREGMYEEEICTGSKEAFIILVLQFFSEMLMYIKKRFEIEAFIDLIWPNVQIHF